MMKDNYGTKLHFSGVESRRLLDTFKDFGVPFISISYYYLKRVFDSPHDAEVYLKGFNSVLIDHGLIYHKIKSEPEKKEFLEGYYDYVSKLDPSVYSAVVAHLDIPLDKLVDENKLLYPLDDLEDMFGGDMKAIFSNIEYIGLSNKITSEEDRMGQISSQANKNGVKLHCFGTASQQVLKKWPIYSANTSSWRTGSRYANTYIYEGVGRGLHLYQPTDKSDMVKTDREKKNVRSRLKNFVETRQEDLYNMIDWKILLEDDDSWEVDKANLTQWILYQRDLALESRLAYWLTEDQKRALDEERHQLANNGQVTSREDPLPEVRKEEIVDAEIVGVALDKPRQARLTQVDDRLLQPRQCNACILANRCPKYQADASCAFGIIETYEVAELDNYIKEDVADLLQVQKDRIMQGYLEEKADGAGLNKDIRAEMKAYGELYALFKAAVDDRDSIELKAKGTGLLKMFQK